MVACLDRFVFVLIGGPYIQWVNCVYSGGSYTVEPPNKGQAGSSSYREVGPYSVNLSLSVKHSKIGSFHTKWPL